MMNAFHFNVYLTYFYFYSVFGWIYETTEVSIKKHKYVNRGFMNGPWLPIYGSGAMIYMVVALPLKEYPVLVFLAGMAAATILEYFTGALMLNIFKVRYWDYSNQKIQLHGHICLLASLVWGLGSLLFVYVLHEPVSKLINKVDPEVINVTTFLITCLMTYDFAVSLRKALDLRAALLQIEEYAKQLNDELGRKKEQLASQMKDYKDDLKERYEESRAAVDKKMQESRKELGQKMQESRKEFGQKMQESRKELGQKMQASRAELEQKMQTSRTELEQKIEKLSVRFLKGNPTANFGKYKKLSDKIRERLHL